LVLEQVSDLESALVPALDLESALAQA